MTPEEQARIQELSRRIKDEKDSEKLMVLAAELERLLTIKLAAVNEKQQNR
jgi:hypothetical protein